ncbi:hypothetical protein ACQPXH_30670 [Nocardia sp. CA-135953]|uniref:hypothetical protein n=1 Tax=Nocardia sp. CA-135953 TaxID=3239978 RepID=UPI003D978B7E
MSPPRSVRFAAESPPERTTCVLGQRFSDRAADATTLAAAAEQTAEYVSDAVAGLRLWCAPLLRRSGGQPSRSEAASATLAVFLRAEN